MKPVNSSNSHVPLMEDSAERGVKLDSRRQFLKAGAALALSPALSARDQRTSALSEQRPKWGGMLGVSGIAQTPVTEMFQGYSSFEDSAKMAAVKGTYESVGAKTRCDYSVCLNTESLMNALDISVSVSDAFGIGSVEAKADFVHKLQITKHSVSVAVYANKVTSSRAATSWKLSVPPPTRANLRSFFRQYGDCYVNQLTRGGEYIGIYVFYSETQEEQTSIQASLQASGLALGGNLDVSLKAAFQQFHQITNVRQNFRQIIFGQTRPSYPNTTDAMIDYALAFGKTTADDPVVISFGLRGYEDIASMPDMDAIISARNLWSSNTEGLTRDIAELQLLNNQIAIIRSIYKTYSFAADTDLEAKATKVKTDWEAATNLRDRMIKDPTEKYQKPPLPSLQCGTPSLNYSVDSAGGWGGTTTGGPFQDVTRNSIKQQVLLTAIQLNGGKYMDHIQCTYDSPSLGVFSKKNGGDGGGASAVFELQPGETITRISGMSGWFVNQLTFTTSTGRSSPTWPTNPEAATPFSWECPQGAVVVGFQGRCGLFLDRLEPTVCRFGAAKWT